MYYGHFTAEYRFKRAVELYQHPVVPSELRCVDPTLGHSD